MPGYSPDDPSTSSTEPPPAKRRRGRPRSKPQQTQINPIVNVMDRSLPGEEVRILYAFMNENFHLCS